VWGGGAPYEVDLTFHPYGPGWHVDRAAFDRMLLDAATERGACVRRGTTVSSIRGGEGGWEVQLAGAAGERLEASFLIDASGRAATVARRIAGGPRLYDDGAALVAFLRTDPTAPAGGVVTLIEAAAEGWWYAGRLPAGRMVAAFLSDADLLPTEPCHFAGFWRERLSETSLAAALCTGAAVESGPRLVRSATARLSEVGGDRWLAVGDAAMAFDPLSSQGVCAALESGRHGGLAAHRRLAGDTQAGDAYATAMETTFRDYLRRRAYYYGREGRWPASPFWHRRRGEALLSA
jgi:flavin-dependent dehydrogenase